MVRTSARCADQPRLRVRIGSRRTDRLDPMAHDARFRAVVPRALYNMWTSSISVHRGVYLTITVSRRTHTHHTAAVKCSRQIGWTPLFVPLAAECRRDTCGFCVRGKRDSCVTVVTWLQV